MFKSLLDLTVNTVRVVTAPVEVVVNVANDFVVKPVAELAQEVVDERTFREYADSLKVINWEGTDAELDVDYGADCATGACPVR